MERRFIREIGSLEAVFAFLDEFAAVQRVAPDPCGDLRLILEELFTNMVRHAKGGTPEISIDLERQGPVATMTLRDFDVDPFDVTRARALDTQAPIAERRPGGMGLHLVNQLADGIHYDYRGRVSTIVVTKRVES